MTNSLRRILAAAALAMLACSEPPAGPHLPLTLNGGWTRADAPAPPAAPEQVTKLGLVRAHSAIYEGNGRIEVIVYQMTSESGAFELVQKWRAEPGTVYLHKGRNFVLLRSPGMDNASLSKLANQIEVTLGR